MVAGRSIRFPRCRAVCARFSPLFFFYNGPGYKNTKALLRFYPRRRNFARARARETQYIRESDLTASSLSSRNRSRISRRHCLRLVRKNSGQRHEQVDRYKSQSRLSISTTCFPRDVVGGFERRDLLSSAEI